jgi:hypothetical protein
VTPAMHRIAQAGDEVADLARFTDIPAEQDEPPGLYVPIESFFVRGEFEAADAENDCF